MKMLKYLVVIFLIVFLIGCTSTNTEVKQPPSDANSIADDIVADNSADTTVKTEPIVEDKLSAEKSLSDILSGSKLKYTADYTISAGGQIIPTTMIIDFPKYVMVTKLTQVETRSIFDGTIFTSCTNMGTWTCTKMTVPAPSNVEMENSVKDGSAKITSKGTCTRAGETGSKYEVVSEITVNGKKEEVTSTVCYTSDGILLEMTTDASNMVATKVSRSIDSTMFIPPATAQDISSMIPPGIPGR